MRTWLFVPGHDSRKLQKALQSAADVVIVDWEDAVADDRKAEARATARSLLPQSGTGPRCVVRINNVQDPHFNDDMHALVNLPISGVMLPKVAQPTDVIAVARQIDQPIIPILETTLGIEQAFAIAQAHEQIERLAFGPLDLLADLGVQWSADNAAYQYARTRVAFAGRAAGLEGAIDGVYPRLDDADGLRRDAAAARSLGYVGKMVIHPAQIPIVQEVFSPTADEVAQATAIMRAFEEAQVRGEAAVRMGSTFIDPPVVRWAQQVIAIHNGDVPNG